jgi:hypothetical protein
MFVYTKSAVASGMWWQMHPDDFAVAINLDMLSHHTSFYYNLYANYVYQTLVSVVNMAGVMMHGCC